MATIQKGFVSFYDIEARFGWLSGVSTADVKAVIRRLGHKAVHCGAPCKGGYGYPESVLNDIQAIWRSKPPHMSAGAWVTALLARPPAELRAAVTPR